MSEALLIQTVASKTSGEIFAAIGVTYPAGSTCKCTNADSSVELEATGTDGAFIFNIPSLGDWEVSCTDGDSTAKETVSIGAQWESKNIELQYNTLILFNNGDQRTDITGGWTSIQDNYLKSTSTITNGVCSTLSSYTYNAIDLTSYNYIYFLVDSVDGTFSSISVCGINATSPEGQPDIKDAPLNKAETISIDISSITGQFYIGIFAVTDSIAGCEALISKVWLEK